MTMYISLLLQYEHHTAQLLQHKLKKETIISSA